jgi:hypothetical protein
VETPPKVSRLNPRQQLGVAVVGVVVTASLALLGASRTWLVRTTPRAAPAPDLVERVSGASLAPALPALALVALAGAGALVATRGRWRTAVGVLITLSGLIMVILLRKPAAMSGIASGWVLVTALCAVAVAIVGAFTLRNGSKWPTMGARYDRPGATAPAGAISTPDRPADIDEESAAPDRPADRRAASSHIGDTGWWDAIDRGEDPTKD